MKDKFGVRMRAWDYFNKEMHYDFQCIWVNSGQEKEIASGLLFSSDLFTPSFEKWPPENDVDRRFSVMEWVHAVDEMNMPIYVNDIIKVTTEEGGEWVGVVNWGHQGCAACWDINEIEEGKMSKACFFDRPNTKFTIIGNVFENTSMVQHLLDKNILKLL